VGFRTGIGLSVQEMWHALSELRGAVELIPYVLGLRPAGPIPEVPSGLRTVRLSTRALLYSWKHTEHPRLDRWLRGADVVHATNFITGPSRLPTLTTVNDIGFVLDPASTNSVIATFPAVLERAVARGCHVHVTTMQVAREVDEHFGPGLLDAGRITVIPFGVPSLGPPGALPADIVDFLDGHPYVLAIGQAERRKNLPRLVEAFGRVAGEDGSMRLVLAGPAGPGSAAIGRAVAAQSAGVRERILVAGTVGGGVRATLVEGARILAYPSLYEGFGFPPLQAMAVGVPVLAARIAVLVEVAGDAAEFADPLDVDDIAAHIRRLVTDEGRRTQLVEAGRRRAAEFSWEHTATGLTSLYRRLANSA
jgi:glycosyltransferase involved in cell wall biosynthesis